MNKLNLLSILFLALLIYFNCTYDNNNIDSIAVSVSSNIFHKDILDEANRLKSFYEEKLKNNIKNETRDIFNPVVTDSMKNERPVKGGSIRVSLNGEPKVLNSYIDDSAYTTYITNYIFDKLVSINPKNLNYKYCLAKDIVAHDVVWLKGTKDNPVYDKDNSNNNYIICDILNVNYSDKENNIIDSIKVFHNNEEKIIKKANLRFKSNSDNTYTRAFDKSIVLYFTIKDNIYWHDGKQFTTDDIIFTLNVIKKSKIPEVIRIRSKFLSIVHFEKLDNFSFVVFLNQQYYKYLQIFTEFYILPKHLYYTDNFSLSSNEYVKYFHEHKNNNKPIGTGKYFLPSEYVGSNYEDWIGWVQGNYLRLERNDKYYLQSNSGYLRTIYFHFITGRGMSSRSLKALKEKKIDFASMLGSNELFRDSNSIQFKKEYVKALYYLPGFSFVTFNLRKKYLDNVYLRKAFTYLTDRQTLLKYKSYGIGKIVTSSQYIFSPFYNSMITPLKYNHRLATELINKAGWTDTDGDGIRDRDGIPLQLTLFSDWGTTARTLGNMLHQELKMLGIKLELKALNWSTYGTYLNSFSYDMAYLAWAIEIEEDPYNMWHSNSAKPTGSNFSGLKNKKVDSIILSIRRELDTDKRYRLHKLLHKTIYKLHPYIFMYCLPYRSIYHNRFRNVKFYGINPGWDLSEWYIPKELQTDAERLAEE